MKALVLSGVSVVLRPRIWSILAGVSKYKRKFGASYFQQLILERETSPVRSHHICSNMMWLKGLSFETVSEFI